VTGVIGAPVVCFLAHVVCMHVRRYGGDRSMAALQVVWCETKRWSPAGFGWTLHRSVVDRGLEYIR
jgi:hypothetical protein